MSVASPNDADDDTVPGAGASVSGVRGDGNLERAFVSRFGRICSAVLPKVDVRGGSMVVLLELVHRGRVWREMVTSI